jgi:hypothetical protein
MTSSKSGKRSPAPPVKKKPGTEPGFIALVGLRDLEYLAPLVVFREAG